MIDASLKSELLKQVDHLPPALQRQVLDFASALGKSMPTGTPGRELLSLAGVLDPQDAKEMMQAIQIGCESVDIHGW